MKWSVLVILKLSYFFILSCNFSCVLVYGDGDLLNDKHNVTLISSLDPNSNYNGSKKTEKRSSPLHPLPSSSSLLLKDDDVSAMDRIQIPIIYHTSIGGKANSYHNFKSDINPHSFIFNSNMKSLRKPSPHSSTRHQSLLTNQGPQVFPLQQNTYPPILQPNSFNSYPSQMYNSNFPPTSQASSSNNPITKHPDLLYYQNFDKLCPASKPYPVYIEKKVPITIEKRVPYPVKVPYPVHHYHYDNVEHRNINAEDLKDGTPPPPPNESSHPPPKVGGLFTGGDKGGYKGDTKEEMYENYDDNNGGERNEEEEEYYDNYEKSSSREIPRNIPAPRNVQPSYVASSATNRGNIKTRSHHDPEQHISNNNSRNASRYGNNQQQNRNIHRKTREEKRIADNVSTVFDDLKKENSSTATTTEKILPQTTTKIGLKTLSNKKDKDQN